MQTITRNWARKWTIKKHGTRQKIMQEKQQGVRKRNMQENYHGNRRNVEQVVSNCSKMEQVPKNQVRMHERKVTTDQKERVKSAKELI